MESEFRLTFKEDVDPRDIRLMTSLCVILFTELINFCKHRKLPLEITSLVNDRGNVKAKSSTHEDGRAFDVSLKGWSAFDIDDCVSYFNTYYRNIAAISSRDQKERAAVYGDPLHLDHIHFQVRRDGT